MKLIDAVHSYRERYDVPLWRAIMILFNKKYCKSIRHMINNEYDLFQFDRLNFYAQREYITGHEIMNRIKSLNNAVDSWDLMDNKVIFDKTFEKYLGREYLEVNASTPFSAFEEFIKRHRSVFIKPLDAFGGRGISRYDGAVDPESLRSLFESLSSAPHIIEEEIDQIDTLAKLFPGSVNTLRVVTMIDREGIVHIPFANIRIGRGNNRVDNFSSGGISAAIDIENGIVMSKGYDKFGNTYTLHPDTGVPIAGLVIPCWETVKRTVLEAAASVPQLRYVGWDVVVRKDGSISFIEGNLNAEARLHQVTLHKGLRSVYSKYLDL